VPEEVDWNSLYGRIGSLPGVARISVDQRL
jgi:hypothetical protein